MRTASRLFSLIVGLGVIAAPSAHAAEEVKPCAAAHFVDQLETIGFLSNTLALLNGSEDPKLRRLLEWRLGAAAADARSLVGGGLSVEAVGLPNFAKGLQSARSYASEHHLPAAVIADLTAVEAWVSKQPWGLSSAPH
jgi:hypothetical protein